jgi:hypothetical protein
MKRAKQPRVVRHWVTERVVAVNFVAAEAEYLIQSLRDKLATAIDLEIKRQSGRAISDHWHASEYDIVRSAWKVIVGRHAAVKRKQVLR